MNLLNIQIEMRQDLVWRLLLLFFAISVIIISSDTSFATSTGTEVENDVIGQSLCRLVKNLTGSTARAIATIAIFTVGAGLFVGKMQWPVAAFTAIGVAIIFSAPKLVAFLSNDSANAACLDSSTST